MKLIDRPGPDAGSAAARVVRWRDGVRSQEDDWLSEEVPVALEFNGIGHAVMLATPLDLEDFALGFGLAEGLFETAADLYGVDVETSAQGVTLRMEVSSGSFARLKGRRRTLAGRTGCGLCGSESLDQVARLWPSAPAAGAGNDAAAVPSGVISMGVAALRAQQVICRSTGSMHAAAWISAQGSVLILREDVGRHNALDKLTGAIARARQAAVHRPPAVGALPGPLGGFIAVTSRASVEMVQKAAVAGSSLLVAVSAPTKLAVQTAQAAGLTLVGLARQRDFVIYTHPHRVELQGS
jgi:FdhD protein